MKAEKETNHTGDTLSILFRDGKAPTEKEKEYIYEQLKKEYSGNKPNLILNFSNEKAMQPKIIPIVNEVEIDFQNPKFEDTSYLAYWNCPKCNEDAIMNCSKYCYECGSKVNWKNTFLEILKQQETQNAKDK